jgi:hypothetical protein
VAFAVASPAAASAVVAFTAATAAGADTAGRGQWPARWAGHTQQPAKYHEALYAHHIRSPQP